MLARLSGPKLPKSTQALQLNAPRRAERCEKPKCFIDLNSSVWKGKKNNCDARSNNWPYRELKLMVRARMLRSNLCNFRKRGPSWISPKRTVEKRYSRQSGQPKLANKTSGRNSVNLKRRCERQSNKLNFVARKSNLPYKKLATVRVV